MSRVLHGIDAIVFDVLGTLVDEAEGLRTAFREATPTAAADQIDHMLAAWREHVDLRQQSMAAGNSEYADSGRLDAEAAAEVARRFGVASPDTVHRMATASRRLPPWDDSAAGLARLARLRPVIALSDASDTALLHLHAHAGFRWHQVISSAQVGAYKPDPRLYRRAVEVAGTEPSRVLMVAAHAWDLRAAQAEGMRTAFIARPVADPPAAADDFDAEFAGLEALAAALER